MKPESSTDAHARTTPPAHHRPAGGFRNPWPGSTPTGFSGLLRWGFERLGRRREPTAADDTASAGAARGATSQAADGAAIGHPRAALDAWTVTAIGHSTFLLQLGGLNILTDPVWAERASPLGFAGPRRHHPPGVALEALPPIDVVLQSHDHYDHFDDAAVRALARRHPQATWCAPLGVAQRLRARGVAQVIERDWWQSATLGAADIGCVPAAHFSGRTPFDRDRTLWCGWTVAVRGRRCYFVGDTGMHPEFGRIADTFGPFDLVLMPIGAYEPRWFMRPVHLDPDEALEAFALLRAADPRSAERRPVMVGMHWGTFTLTDEPRDEPPRRAREGWRARGWPADDLWLLTPGETRALRTSP